MRTEFYIGGLPERYIRFVLTKVLEKDIICIATAKRNMQGNRVNIFDVEFESPIAIFKGQRFLVVSGEEWEYGMIKRAFIFFRPIIYQAEEIVCQTKWKGQPYKFFFKYSAS